MVEPSLNYNSTTRNTEWTQLNGSYIAQAKLNVDMLQDLMYLFCLLDGKVSVMEIPRNPDGMKTFRGDLENGTVHNLSLDNGIENGSAMNVWIARDIGFRFLLDKKRTDVRLYHKPIQEPQDPQPVEIIMKKLEVIVNKNNNVIMVKKALSIRKIFQCDEMA